MKKIKINKNVLNKGKYVLITIPVVATLVLSGCELSANGERARYSNTQQVTNSSISENTDNSNINNEFSIDENNIENSTRYNLDDLNIPLKDIGNINLSNIGVKYNNNQNISFISYLNSVDVLYDYEDIYNFQNALYEYNKLLFTNSHNLKLQNLDENELYNIIKENNKEYKKNNNSSIYKELDTKEAKKITNIIITTVKDFVQNNSDISVDRIKCVLSDLKLFKQNSALSNAFVTDNNCLIISPNMLKFANTINGKGTDEDVLKHEIIHLLQKGCNCDLNQNSNLKRNFGICYGFKNIEINSLQFSWLYEASAEKSMVNYTGHKSLVYKNMIGYLESLSIVNIINDTYKVNDTENLCFKRSIDDLYKYFDVTTENEKREILNLMYSIEVMQQAPSDFYKLLEQKTGKKKDNTLIDEVNYTIKGSICETLTKLFYRNLSKSIVNKDISLGDIFYLISLFENDINNHVLYTSIEKYNYNEHFINTYKNIQDNFFLELSKSINWTQEELENSYNYYTSIIKQGEGTIKNYNLNFLSQEKIDYLAQRENELNSIAGATIRNIASQFAIENVQKVY